MYALREFANVGAQWAIATVGSPRIYGPLDRRSWRVAFNCSAGFRKCVFDGYMPVFSLARDAAVLNEIGQIASEPAKSSSLLSFTIERG